MKSIDVWILYVLFVFILFPRRIMSQSGAPATAFALENSVAAIRSIETGLDDMSQDNQSMSPRREPRREPQPEPSAPPAPQAAERATGEAQHAGFSLQVRSGTICDLRDSWCRSEWQSETWTPRHWQPGWGESMIRDPCGNVLAAWGYGL